MAEKIWDSILSSHVHKNEPALMNQKIYDESDVRAIIDSKIETR